MAASKEFSINSEPRSFRRGGPSLLKAKFDGGTTYDPSKEEQRRNDETAWVWEVPYGVPINTH